MRACIYLRKSRADEELEKLGNGNTLNRHKTTLLKLASEMNLNIISIHEEIVSGESLSLRPEMLKLLEEISNNRYDAVLVMDMDRLGRGNMQEQGLILEAFKQSNTKIITPRKTYDLNDEFDEEYSEFEAFMARKELKIINRRMQRGRVKSVEEGNYIGTYPPFGYKFEGHGRTRRLLIDPETAPIVKMIFELYAAGLGGSKIAYKLNDMGYKTQTGKAFYHHSIINIIKNPIYIGKLTWGKKKYYKGNLNKRRTVELVPRDDWTLYDGKHESIITEELYNDALKQLNNKTLPPSSRDLVNPFAGLIFCSACNRPMMYRSYGNSLPHVICYNEYCKQTQSSRFDYVEERIINEINQRLRDFDINMPTFKPISNNYVKPIQHIKNELNKLNTQKNNLHDLLEQGIYDLDTFLERNEVISNKLDSLEQELEKLQKASQEIISYEDISKQIHNVLNLYGISDNVQLKNKLMKTIIDKIIYIKPKGSKPFDFELNIVFKFKYI